MESLDNSFDKCISVVTDTLNGLKTSLKTFAEKEQVNILNGKLDGIRQDISTSNKRQEEHSTMLESVKSNISALNQKELADIDSLDEEVNSLKTQMSDIESNLSNIKTRLEKVHANVVQISEFRRSLRAI
jgi:chromosome segregation ATPase